MEKRTFKITLADGTALEGLTLNGNNYISDKKVTEDVFRDNLSKVTIEGPDGAQEHENMKLVQIEYSYLHPEVRRYWQKIEQGLIDICKKCGLGPALNMEVTEK